MTDLSQLSSSAYWRVLQQDVDPVETGEWVEAFDTLVAKEGRERATFILRKLLDRARARHVALPPVLNTPYCNTIPLAQQPQYPGNLDIEQRIGSIVRWNALAMVVRANRDHPELGGHIATYASIADLFEVGFNHFFRGGQQGDLVYFQPHAAPGVYARAFIEGRLTEAQLTHYRRETGAAAQGPQTAPASHAGRGLSSYCHPYLMPDFWQFPNASMGVGPITAIYQARFMRYLENRGILETASRKVWAFVGDGEMDEPESLAGLSTAAREGLDNLVFVVNCNLQRLDGPVRGNGSIIQELEGLFAGAGWNVIKLLWGSDWDSLFARDEDNVIIRRLHETVDGEFQKYAATDGQFNREHFFNKYPELQQLAQHLSDDDIDRLRRGGHDAVKINAAYHAAAHYKGRPTVILAQTKKGYGMGHWGQGRMGAHQAKKLENDALLAFRDRFALPISDDDVHHLRFYKPADDSPEMRYLHQHREKLGGYMPVRNHAAPALPVPALETFGRILEGSRDREESTTMVFVRLLAQLLKDENIGRRIVPIVADEARTFGMQSLFRQVAIYSSVGQLYEPEDRDELLYYKEARDGQILEEGINEAGAMSSWIAAATSYSAHGVPMLPFYIFYSMFGFQRVGDFIWAAADSRARGFLVGATAGRTTLSGEGLQHEDGSSHLVASTIPSCCAYDPCFGYELATIVREGTRRMLEGQQDVFYYVTVMNENYAQAAMPANAAAGILRGMYRFSAGGTKGASAEASAAGDAGAAPKKTRARSGKAGMQGASGADAAPAVQLLGSGTILREVIAAAEMLSSDFGVTADVWSVTSYTELRRDGMDVERWNTLHPIAPQRSSYVEQCLSATTGPIVAASDYVRAVPDLVRTWMPRRYVTLGTDGFGRSDTREALRRFFEVDRTAIVVAALKALADEQRVPASVVADALKRYAIEPDTANPWDS